MQKKLLGHVGVDSGQLIICDPCYIDSQWQKRKFQDTRLYQHKKTKRLFLYDDPFNNRSKTISIKTRARIEKFKHFEAPTSYKKKTMNQMIESKEIIEIKTQQQLDLIGEFSYAGVSETSLTGKNQIKYKMGHDGAAVVFKSGYGDGFYEVYGTFNKDGRCIKVEINCDLTPVQKKILNI